MKSGPERPNNRRAAEAAAATFAMRLRIVLIPALCAATLIAAVPAIAGTPCSKACRATLTVGSKPVHWVWRQSFPDRTPVDVTMTVDGEELDAELVRDCAANYYGAGVVARLEGCDRPRSRIRVRAVSVVKPVKLRIVIRAG